MDAAVWSSVVAVAGTLAGGLVANVVQARMARTARVEARRDAHRAEALAAVKSLVAALADHRRAMWQLGDRVLSGADRRTVDAAEAAHHETRSAITGPLVIVDILAPVLSEVAHRATDAVYAMRNPSDLDALEALRAKALAVSSELVSDAISVFSDS